MSRQNHSSSTERAKAYRFETISIHAGNPSDPLTGAVATPIYQTTTYAQD
jgi:O-acetylhomoserine/O-acetylserine sulfhydrylase-like pyridoxal-dependent enzyme